jgi:hypothetical protein
MARKGMMVGSGKRGYHNIIGKDPHVHSQSAKGMKQPQSVNILITPALKKKSYKDLKRSGIILSKNGDADHDGVKNLKDCKPLNAKKQDDMPVTEIEIDPNVDEDNETAFEKVKGRTEALAQRGIRAGKEAYSKYQKEKEEKEKLEATEDVEIAKHPIISQISTTQGKIDALQEKITNLPEDSDLEEELFEKLEAEQEELDEMKEFATKIKLEEYSDRQLKELAVRHNDDNDTDFFGNPKKNKYEEEYIRRLGSRKEVEKIIADQKEELAMKELENTPMEKFSDADLKRLSISKFDSHSLFGDDYNKYHNEYLKRVEKRKELAKQPKNKEEGFFSGIF